MLNDCRHLYVVVPVNSLQQFKVLTSGVPPAQFECRITSPSRNRVRAHIIPTEDGYLVNFVPSELGDYLLDISVFGKSLDRDPIVLESLEMCDFQKVTATGLGLVRGIVGHSCSFEIDTRSAGQAGLGVTVEGPVETAISCRDNGDGTATCAYFPIIQGLYIIHITFDNYQIIGSPFKVNVFPELNMDVIKIDGVGIQAYGKLLSNGCRLTLKN